VTGIRAGRWRNWSWIPGTGCGGYLASCPTGTRKNPFPPECQQRYSHPREGLRSQPEQDRHPLASNINGNRAHHRHNGLQLTRVCTSFEASKVIKTVNVWVVTPSAFVRGYQYFGGTRCLQLQSKKGKVVPVHN
jgi:hypothetical protein